MRHRFLQPPPPRVQGHVLAPVYLAATDGRGPDVPGGTASTSLVLARPAEGVWATGRLEIGGRPDPVLAGSPLGAVRVALAFDAPYGTDARLILDRTGAGLGGAILGWVDDLVGGPTLDAHSLRRAVADGRDEGLEVDVLSLDAGQLVPLELAADEDGDGWDESGRFTCVVTREVPAA